MTKKQRLAWLDKRLGKNPSLLALPVDALYRKLEKEGYPAALRTLHRDMDDLERMADMTALTSMLRRGVLQQVARTLADDDRSSYALGLLKLGFERVDAAVASQPPPEPAAEDDPYFKMWEDVQPVAQE